MRSHLSLACSLNGVCAAVAAAVCLCAVEAAAETVDHVNLTANTVWTIPAGEVKHVEYLTADGELTLTVKGGGTLELAVVDATNLTVRVLEGQLSTVRPVEMSAPEMTGDDWTYHLDASKSSTVTLSTKPRDGQPSVFRWYDVDGRAHPHPSKTTDPFFAGLTTENATTPRAFYRENFQNGLAVVDLGPYYNKAIAATLTATNCYLPFNGSYNNMSVTNHVEVFSVWQDHPEASSCEAENAFIGPQAMLGGTAFARGRGGNGKGFKLFEYSSYVVNKGEIWLDGEQVTYSTVPDEGWHVLNVRGDVSGKASSGACIGMTGWSVYAGARYGEVWAFSKRLEAETSARIRAYLASKWLGPRLAAVELTNGATLNPVGLLRGQVLRGFTGAVWDDCDLVFDGATDKNGDGLFQTGELVDLRHASEPTRWTQKITRPGSDALAGQVTIGTEDVLPANAATDGTTFRQSFISVHQAETTNATTGAVTFKPMCLQFPDGCGPSYNSETGTNDIYTMLFRFRVNRYCGTGFWTLLHANSWYSSEKGGGPLIRIAPKTILEPNGDGSVTTNYWDATEGRLTVNIGTVGAVASSDFQAITNGCWYELAVVMNKDGAYVGLGPNNSHMAFKSWKRTSSQKMTLAPKGVIKFFSESTSTSQSALKPAGSKNGDGDLAFFAMWSRALSTNEIRQAFSRAGAAVMGVGVPGLSRSIFAGAENFAGEKTFDVDAVDWSEMPRSLATGAKLNFRFKVPNWRYDLAQFLRIGTTQNSAAGTIRATVGGSAATVRLMPGGVANAHFPRGCFPTNTVLTLTLERTDAGTDPVELDFAELSGSWRLGHWNGKSDASSEAYGYPDYMIADRNGMDWCQAATTLRTNETGTVRTSTGKKSAVTFTLPPDLNPANCVAKITFATHTYQKGTANPLLNLSLRLNDAIIGRYHVGDNGPEGSERLDVPKEDGLPKRFTISLKTGTLQPGENKLVWGTEGLYYEAGWAAFDFLQFELRTPSGLVFLAQ